jgi:hypothetical protein
MARPGLEPVRTMSPVMAAGCPSPVTMARPGLEPVRTMSPVMVAGCPSPVAMARPGLEPGTPRFSDRCSEHSKRARNCLQTSLLLHSAEEARCRVISARM